MTNIKQDLETLKPILSGKIDEVISTLVSLDKEIESYKEKASTERGNYITIKAKADEVQKEIDKASTAIEVAKQELASETESVRRLGVETSNKVEKLNNEIDSLNMKKTKLESEVSKLEKNIVSLNDMIDVKSGVILEVQELNDKLNLLKKDVTLLEMKKEKTIEDTKQSVLEIVDDSNKLAEELNIKSKELLRREVLVTEKEKANKEKEESLKTLEERYRKLFGDKGIVFKI